MKTTMGEDMMTGNYNSTISIMMGDNDGDNEWRQEKTE